MKKFLFGCALAVSAFQAPSASAQDMCCQPQCDPCCNYGSGFDGFYFGGNVGALSHTAHRIDFDGFLVDRAGWSTINTNVTAGVQLGYDWQCSSTLFGVVGDWNWVNTRHRVSFTNDDGDFRRFRSNNNWFSTIRGRAGITVCDALFYVTAGAAATRVKHRWDDDSLDNDGFRRTRWGWVGGVGTEFLLGCNWSVGFELLSLNFDTFTRSFDDADGDTFRFGHGDSAWVGRLTLNYRFGNLCCF